MSSPPSTECPPPYRQIRAAFTDTTITVYQAYSDVIAEWALHRQTFASPFKFDRMTWIKPSFLWMMYRSGWGSKEGQTRVLAIDICRDAFLWFLENACLSRFDPAIHLSETAWKESKAKSPVQVQWDPERSLRLERLQYRSIQIGLSGIAVEKYTNESIRHIRDVTSLARRIHDLADSGAESAAIELLPAEAWFPANAPHLGLTSATDPFAG
jgi:hypothetical protein